MSLMKVERRLETVLPNSLTHDKPLKSVGLLLLILIFALLFNENSSVEDLRKAGELIVISRESPTILYRDNEGPAGPDYDYLKTFAEFLGVSLRLDLRDNNQDVLAAIANGEGHIAATGMTFYPPLEDQGLVFGPGYQDVDIQVVCRRNNGKRPRNIDELSDIELVVVADSIQESRLFELQQGHSDLTWESAEDTNVDDLLEQVWRREIDCTIANSNEINIKRRFYPELQVAFTIEENQALAWNLSPEWEALSDSIEQWLRVTENDGSWLDLKGVLPLAGAKEILQRFEIRLRPWNRARRLCPAGSQLPEYPACPDRSKKRGAYRLGANAPDQIGHTRSPSFLVSFIFSE